MKKQTLFKTIFNFGRIINVLLFIDILLLIYTFFMPTLPRLPLILVSKQLLFLHLIFLLIIFFFIKKNLIREFFYSQTFKKNIKIFLLILIIILITRIPFLIHNFAYINSDSSVTLLMIKNISKGEDHPIYFYGQFYQGSLFAYISSLFYLCTNHLKLSVIIVNILLYSLFIFVCVFLLNKISDNISTFYTIIFLSIPITASQLFTAEYIRGYSLIILLEILLITLTYLILFEKRKHFFLIGLISGILFWIYQPSISIILISLLLIFLHILIKKKIIVFLNAIFFILFGFFWGCFPHILAEINNKFINTKAFYFFDEKINILDFFKPTYLFKIFSAPLSNLDSSKIVSFTFIMLFIVGFLTSIYLSIKKKSLKKSYLPFFFFLNLLIISISGFPPTDRYIIHYSLYSFLVLLFIVLFFKEIRIFNKKILKMTILIFFITFSLIKIIQDNTPARESHTKNLSDIQAINNIENKIILGNYWSTMIFSPFLNKNKVINPKPFVLSKSGILRFSKYYPNALKLGNIWHKEKKTLIFLEFKEKDVDELFNSFDIQYKKKFLPSKNHIFYSDFSKNLSTDLISIISLNPKENFIKNKKNNYFMAKKNLSNPEQLKIECNNQTLFLPYLNKNVQLLNNPEFLRECKYVLLNGNFQISFYLHEKNNFHKIPDWISIKNGTYRRFIYFQNIPLYNLGESRLELNSNNELLILSNLRDTLYFYDCFQTGKKEKKIKGIPVNNLRLKILNKKTTHLELHLYSLMDFSSSIWNNRYKQILYINKKPIILEYGKNKISYYVKHIKEIQFITRFKTLLSADNSRGKRVFLNSGIILEKIIVHTKDLGEKSIIPFLN